jgi:hypothetical protein
MLIMKKYVKAFIAHPLAPLLIAIFSLIINFFMPPGGFSPDDYFHRVKVQGNAALCADGLLHSDIPSLETSTADLFNWVCPRCAPAQTAYGFLPWWTAPNLQISFFRPLSSLTHWIDYTLWPNAIAIMQFENLLCLAALVGIFFFLYRKTIKTDTVALLAIVFIVLNVRFFYIADWIAARNSLLAALFGIGSIGAYHVFQSSQRLPSIFLSVFLFIMGLFSGESAVAAFAYIVS